MKRFKFKNKKHMCLALVALILTMLMTVSVTYAWIDDLKQIQITTSDDAEGTPLKTGVDINAKVNITKKNNSVNLGDMIVDSDIKNTENETTALKYDNNGTPSKNYDTNTINEKKGYFYESGDMHLSSCYSDGEHFYFKRNNSSSSFREGNKDDENVNYISFTVQVSSPYADVDFWFKSVPKIKKHNTETAIDTARFGINANGQNHVYSSDGTALTCNSGLTGTTAVSGVRKTADYTYNNENNTTDDRGDNSNVLFSVKKGDTINVTFKIWNEGSFTNVSATDIDMEIVSSWAYTRTIRIVDRTTNSNGVSWIDDDDATMYFTLPRFMEDRTNSVANWSSITDTDDYTVPFKEINNNTYKHTATDSEGNEYTYYEINVPLVFNNEEMIIYRCDKIDNGGWNHGNHSKPELGDHGVTYWNWWKTYLPNTYSDETYTIYGSSYDTVASWRFDNTDTTATYKGYGTWGGVDHIKVYSHYGGTDYASKGSGANLFVRDFSDEATSGEKYTYIMYRADNNSSTPWRVYLPKSSSLIQFHYHNNDISAYWGYKSWKSGDYYNPQQRPLKSTGLYSSNSREYHFARNYGNDSDNKGWGYWEGAECVYLIKSGFLSPTSTIAHAYMFDRNTVYLKPNSDWQNNSATFKAYAWDNSNHNTGELSMTKVSEDPVIYKANVPTTHSWTGVLFRRYNSNGNTQWNVTTDLGFRNGGVYTITGQNDSQYDGNGNKKWNCSDDVWQKSNGITDSETLTRLQDTNGQDVSYTWDGGTKTAEVWKSGSARVYNSVIFNNGYSGNNNQTGDLDLFPGCFYQVDGDHWYGSLTDTARSAAGESSGGSDDSGNTGTATTITNTEPASGLYAYGKLSGSSNTEYAKFSNSLSTGTITLYLNQNTTYNFLLRYRSSNSNGWTEYGTQTYDGPTLSSSTSGETRNINTTYKQKIKLKVNTSGYYKIKINSISSTNATVQFDWN